MRFLVLVFSLMPLLSLAQPKIVFSFSANGQPLVLNEMRYTSAAGLRYQVSQVQFFVSNICTSDAKVISGKPHYVDAEIPATQRLAIPDGAEISDSLTFVFGIPDQENRSYMYRNPPENLMFWPDYLGGGYHYMKTNILYQAPDGQTSAFNCHIGRGQIYNQDGEPTGYIDNSVRITVPVVRDSAGNIVINLNVDRIFDYPSKALFTDYRGIMNNQPAMSMFVKNITEAFGSIYSHR